MNFEKLYSHNHKSYKYLSNIRLIMSFLSFSYFNHIYIGIIYVYVIPDFSDLHCLTSPKGIGKTSSQQRNCQGHLQGPWYLHFPGFQGTGAGSCSGSGSILRGSWPGLCSGCGISSGGLTGGSAILPGAFCNQSGTQKSTFRTLRFPGLKPEQPPAIISPLLFIDCMGRGSNCVSLGFSCHSGWKDPANWGRRRTLVRIHLGFLTRGFVWKEPSSRLGCQTDVYPRFLHAGLLLWCMVERPQARETVRSAWYSDKAWTPNY